MIGWLVAWWRQIRGETGGDPWTDDPQIVEARRRQHELGISDHATVAKFEADFWRREIDRQQRGSMA